MNINLTLIGQAISFAIFVWFCMKYVWPPILRALQERETQIADGLAAAEKGQETLVQAEQRHGELIEEGKHQVVDMIAQASKRGDDMVDEAKNDARSEGERLLSAARAEIEQERTQARENLKKEVAALALAAAEQILMREVDKEAHNEVLAKLTSGL